MEIQPEKVFVAVCNDLQEGLGTLEWAIRNWPSQTISLVIVHIDNTSKYLVNTPFGKLPASSVSDEKLEILRMCEQEKTDKLLSKYMAFCGKVKTEVLKIEKSEEPIYEVIVGLISRHQVTKLVMGITLMKSSSWKTKTAISGLYYIHKHKPSSCQLYIICGGKLVFLKEENDEGYVEDDRGVMVARMKDKASIKGWLGKIFADNTANSGSHGRGYPHHVAPASPSTESIDSRHWWEDNAEEIEKYFQGLSASRLIEEDCVEEATASQLSPMETVKQDHVDLNMSVQDRIQALRAKIEEAHKTIEKERKEAKAEIERQSRAEWAISLCNRRAEELEARINEEITIQSDLKNDLDAARDNIYEVSIDVEESKSRLSSILELQSELAAKLQSSSSEKSRVEAQLENAAAVRTEILREIDELRRQRDMLRRRIKFCRERDAMATATTSSNGLNYSYREFTEEEIRMATDDFSERMRLKSRGGQTNVYKGRLNHTRVAIKLHNSLTELSEEEFRAKIEVLCHIRHPHLISMIGACPEKKCIVFEYMHNGSLQDILFSTQRNARRKNKTLHWHARIRIASEISSGLGFLHLAEPRPLVHGDLNPSNVLLDRNLIAKITGFQLAPYSDESELRTDVCAFGVLMLQLLTGREGVGLVEEVTWAMEGGALIGILDEMAGQWPMDLAEEFVGIAMKCVYVTGRRKMELRTAAVMKELEELRRKAAEVVAKEGCEVVVEGGLVMVEDCSDVPSVFLCPIMQEVMKNPHVAADGFSYEVEAIEEWLGTGHETSPMTNLKLKNKVLTPNHTLRSLIQEWLSNRSTSL